MDRQSVLAILREHEPELKAAGLAHLRLFGSVARGEANQHSDVDIMAEFDPAKTLSLLTVVHFENQLGDLLGTRVDLSSATWMKEPVRVAALKDAIHVY